MKRSLMAAAIIALTAGLATAGDVVIPEDTTPFTVQASDTVRIPVKGIAGAKVKANVTGPAKGTVNSLSYRRNGKMPIGAGDKEVEVKPSGKGKVTVEITMTSPIPGTPEKSEKYEFEVK